MREAAYGCLGEVQGRGLRSVRLGFGITMLAAVLMVQGCATQGGPASRTTIPRPGPSVVTPQASLPAEVEPPPVQTVPLDRAIPPRPQAMPMPEYPAEPTEQHQQPDNPVVIGLLHQADQFAQAGKLDRAAASIERGLRIAPKDASLWQRLANIRLAQGDYRQAESMAKKSIALARGHRGMLADNWKIIAQARELRGDQHGAMVAREKSLQFSSPGF